MAIPEYPISRVEHYLARANGQNVTPPEPISRIEHYLAGIAGGVPQELLDDVADLKRQMDQKAPAIMQTVNNQVIASFADGADDMPLKSLVATINPVQAGTGDPSTENVRPITGWNAVTVTVNDTEQTVDLGQTVYGGTLDVVSGFLTVDVGFKTFNAADGWTLLQSGLIFSDGVFDLGANTEISGNNKFGCNKYMQGAAVNNSTVAANRPNGTFFNQFSSGSNRRDRCYIRDDSITTLDDWAVALAESPLQLTYPLDTPVIYQLTPVEVKTLLGQNNIFADTGNVTVVYPADTKTYIDNQIATLQALVLENISNS